MYAVYRYAIQTSDMAYDGCPTDKTLPTLVLVCSDLSCPGPVRFPHPIHGCSWCKSIPQHDQHASTFVDLHIAIWQNTYPGEFTMSAHAKEKWHKQSHVFPKWPWMMGEVENPAPDLWLHSETCDFNDFNTAPRGRPIPLELALLNWFHDFLISWEWLPRNQSMCVLWIQFPSPMNRSMLSRRLFRFQRRQSRTSAIWTSAGLPATLPLSAQGLVGTICHTRDLGIFVSFLDLWMH